MNYHLTNSCEMVPSQRLTRYLLSDIPRRSYFVTNSCELILPQATGATVAPTTAATSTATVVPSPDPVEANFLPLDWILDPDKRKSISERVLAHRLLAEAKAGTYEEKLAERLAWHIVLHCMKGDAVECSPVTLAYYSVVGCHEEQYYDRVMIRRAAMFGRDNVLQMPKKALTSSGQVSPSTANTSEHAGRSDRLQERGISPDSVPSPKFSPKSSPKKSDEEKSA